MKLTVKKIWLIFTTTRTSVKQPKIKTKRSAVDQKKILKNRF